MRHKHPLLEPALILSSKAMAEHARAHPAQAVPLAHALGGSGSLPERGSAVHRFGRAELLKP